MSSLHRLSEGALGRPNEKDITATTLELFTDDATPIANQIRDLAFFRAKRVLVDGFCVSKGSQYLAVRFRLSHFIARM